jgi:stage II sporulation protein D
MKKKLMITATIIIILLIAIFVPISTEHAVYMGSSLGYSNLYVDGKLKRLKASLNFPLYSVVNYKHNLFKYYGFKSVEPLLERVMVKSSTSYEFESSGSKQLSTKTFYYTVDKNNKLTPSDSRQLIVGKDNVKSFVDKKGQFRTFIIYPMDYSSMRVCISTTGFSSLNFDKTTIKCMKASEIYSKQEKFSMNIPENTEVSISYDNGKVKLSLKDFSKDFTSRLYMKGTSMYINTIVRGAPPFVPSYDGILEFYPGSKGFLIINEVNLEDYLYKVVPSEMPTSGGLEALKCQAIAARTYAISDMLQNRFASQGFYVDDSTQSQVYNNTKPQSLSTKAVTETKGMILTYNGKPIDAKYYSTSAGTGVNARDIWFNPDGTGDAAPYLVTHNYLSLGKALPKSEADWLKFYKDTKVKAIDSISPYFRWNVIFTPQTLTKTLTKSLKSIYDNRKEFMTILVNGKTVDKLPEFKDLKDIKILSRSEGGNVKEISFIFDNVTVNVKADNNIRGALRSSKDFAGEIVPVNRYKFAPITTGGYLPSSFFSVEKVSGNYIIYGGGYGHGVGMSQYGAMELSKKGTKFKDIINTYYKNVTFDNIY